MPAKKLRHWVQRITHVWHWIAAFSFLAYVLMVEEANRAARNLLMFVAAAELVGLTLEAVCRRFDQTDSIKLREELEEIRRNTTGITDRVSPRNISAAAKEILKNRLRKYENQKYRVFQVGVGDDEAMNYANEINVALSECGWSGEAYVFNPAGSEIHIHSGVSVQMSIEDMKATFGALKISPLYIDLNAALAESGVRMAGVVYQTHKEMPIPNGTIEIVVGPKMPL